MIDGCDLYQIHLVDRLRLGELTTRLSAITPRLSTKRARRWLNGVSTDLGEGHRVYALFPILV